jgi:LPXTG-motif cell wall-anchored protein
LDNTLWVITGSDGNFTILTSVGDHNLTFSGGGLKNRTMDIEVPETGLALEDVEMDTIDDDSDGDSNDSWLIAAVVGIIALAVGSIGYIWWRKNKK